MQWRGRIRGNPCGGRTAEQKYAASERGREHIEKQMLITLEYNTDMNLRFKIRIAFVYGSLEKKQQ